MSEWAGDFTLNSLCSFYITVPCTGILNTASYLLCMYVCMYVYGSLTLSILTITQRHGDDGVVSRSAVWVMVGLGMKGGVIGGVWEVWGGLCVGGRGGECALCIG